MAIFPSSFQDIDWKIIGYCDTDTQIRLSGVNRKASELLSNVEFFHDLFFIQHPLLEPFDKVCSILRSHHPFNCWKVMCKAMDPQYREQFPERFNPSFFEKAVPGIQDELQTKKQRLEEKVKGICGSYYADPSSPIEQAWKEYKKCEQDQSTVFPERRMLNYKRIDAKKSYDKLERDREACESEIEKIKQDLANVPNKHQNDLNMEFIGAFSLENALKIKPHLDKCYALLQMLTLRRREITPEALGQVRQLINACTYEQETPLWESYCYWGSKIWKDLYLACANRVIEDSWAEKHFQDFLASLYCIVGDAKRTLNSRIQFGHSQLKSAKVTSA